MNILFILGASSTIHPIAATSQNIIDTFVLIGVSLLIYGIAKKGDTMTRKRGSLWSSYMSFIWFILLYARFVLAFFLSLGKNSSNGIEKNGFIFFDRKGLTVKNTVVASTSC